MRKTGSKTNWQRLDLNRRPRAFSLRDARRYWRTTRRSAGMWYKLRLKPVLDNILTERGEYAIFQRNSPSL